MKLTKKIKLSTVALIALGNIAFAGGDLSTVTPYEIIDEVKAAKIKVEVAPVKVLVVPKVEVVKKEASPWYVGAGLVGGQAKAQYCEDKTYGLMAKLGYDFSDYVGVEARALKTNWEYEGGKLEHIGAFLKPMYPVSEDLKLYGLAGYARTSMGDKRIFADEGLAYGLGVDYALNEDFGLFVDYERLLHNTDSYTFDALSLGLSYNF